MDFDDSNDSDVIVICEVNEEKITTNQSNNRPAEPAVNLCPYKCKFCGSIHQLPDEVKLHYEKVHIRHKAKMCNIETDSAYNVTPSSQLNDVCQKIDNDSVALQKSVDSISGTSVKSEFAPQQNILENSLSTNEELTSQPPVVKKDNVLDTSCARRECEAAQPLTRNDDQCPTTSTFMQKTKPGPSNKMFKVKSESTNTAQQLRNPVSPLVKNEIKRIVKEVKNGSDILSNKSDNRPAETAQQNISGDSQSTSKAESPLSQVVRKDNTSDTNPALFESLAAQPSPRNDGRRSATSTFVQRRKPGRPRKMFKSQSKKPSTFDTMSCVSSLATNANGRTVKEVSEGSVPIPKVSNWFTNCYPLRDPYYPQIGDEVTVLMSAYRKFEECLTKECAVLKKPKIVPEISQLQQFNGVVNDITFEYRNLDGDKYVILMTVKSECGKNVKLLWCNYPKPEYIVLKIYNSCGYWLVGDRFRSLKNQTWRSGYITKFAPLNRQSLFHCFEVTFDNGDIELLSPWDLFEENISKKQDNVKNCMRLSMREISLLLYIPDADEWPAKGRNVECERILKGIRALLTLKIGSIFCELHSNTLRYNSVHDLDLHVVIRRLEHTFYRRINALLFDVRLVKETISLCDFDSDSKQKVNLVLELLEQFILKPECNDFLQFVRQSVRLSDLDYQSNDTVDKLSKNKKKKLRTVSETSSVSSIPSRCSSKSSKNAEYECTWRDACIQLIDKICKKPFAEPFIEPVSLVEFPDYLTYIQDPIDLNTIRGRLESKFYLNSDDLKKDINLLIINSRHYNPDKNTAIYYLTTHLKNDLDKGIAKIFNDISVTETFQKRAKRKRFS